MKTLLTLLATLCLALPVLAADGDPADLANRAKFAKACKPMISVGGPCARVKMGGGGRRRCVDNNITDPKVTPECKASIDEWKALPK